jgi:16S rRNA (guanine966-N2)-methyltransferase
VRVIAGAAKGRRLAAPPAGVRPVSDRVREGIFSSLGTRVVGAAVLDLYAGTGAMGIEALSRGAERATFVDRSPASGRTIAQNLDRTGLGERARVSRRDARAFLEGNDIGGPFHLAIVDPPYEVDVAQLGPVLGALATRALPEDDWTVVLTRRAKSSTPVIPINWFAARRLDYGDSLVTLFRPARRP